MSDPNPPAGAITGSLRDLGANLLELAWTRAELIAVEFQEEKERTAQRIILATVAALFLALGLLLAAILVIVLLWDTYRGAAAAGVTLLYTAIGAWALLRLRAMGRDSPAPFSATIDEFRTDFKAMRERDE